MLHAVALKVAIVVIVGSCEVHERGRAAAAAAAADADAADAAAAAAAATTTAIDTADAGEEAAAGPHSAWM